MLRSWQQAEYVAIERHGASLVVKVPGIDGASKPGFRGVYNSLKLYLPEGRNITVLGRNLVLSGDIAAKNLTVKAISVSMHALKVSASEGVSVAAGTGQLKFTLAAAKKLTVKVDRAWGKIIVPASAELDCPEKDGLQIVRTAGPKSPSKMKS